MNTKSIVVFSMLILLLGTPALAKEASLDTQAIERLTGLKGKLNEQEGVFKVSFPRSDLKITINGVKMNPAMGLTAWAAFTKTGSHTSVMGDVVLLEEQVNPVMSVALENGLEVTALHNHFLHDSPKVMFMYKKTTRKPPKKPPKKPPDGADRGASAFFRAHFATTQHLFAIDY